MWSFEGRGASLGIIYGRFEFCGEVPETLGIFQFSFRDTEIANVF